MCDLAPIYQPPVKTVSYICHTWWKVDSILTSFISQISGCYSGTSSSVVICLWQQYVRSTNMMTRLIQESKYHSAETDSRVRWFCAIPLYSICPVVSTCWSSPTYMYKKLTCFCFIQGAWTAWPYRHVQTDRDFITSLRLHIQTCSLTVAVSDIAVISKFVCKLLPL